MFASLIHITDNPHIMDLIILLGMGLGFFAVAVWADRKDVRHEWRKSSQTHRTSKTR